VLFLRHDVDTLAKRAAKLGAYRGAEAMVPRTHVEESTQHLSSGEGAQITGKPSAPALRWQAIAKLARRTVAAAAPARAMQR
jgi:hypothetical protein